MEQSRCALPISKNIFFVLLLICLFAISANVFARAAIEIVHIQGEAIVGRKTPLKEGTVLRVGSIIQTKKESRVLVRFSDGSTMLIQPESKIKFVEARKRRNGFSLLVDLISGQVDNVVVSKQTGEVSYRVRTRSALAGVRGTSFRVQAEANGQKTVAEVLEGVVDFRRRRDGRRLELTAGEGSLVTTQRTQPVEKVSLPMAPKLIDFSPAQYQSTVHIKAEPVANADQYRIEVSHLPTFESILHQVTVAHPVSSIGDLADGQYYIRIRAIDNKGFEGPDTTVSFTVDGRAQPPFLVFPTDGFATEANNVAFEWTQGIDISGYRFRIATDPQFQQVIVEEEITTNRFNIPLSQGHYFWQVAAKRDGEYGPYTEPLAITISPVTVGMLKTVSRAERGQFDIMWENSAAKQFEVQIADNAAFYNPQKTWLVPSPKTEIVLEEPGKYYLRVRGIDINGQPGPYSEVQQIEFWRPFPWWVLGIMFVGL